MTFILSSLRMWRISRTQDIYTAESIEQKIRVRLEKFFTIGVWFVLFFTIARSQWARLCEYEKLFTKHYVKIVMTIEQTFVLLPECPFYSTMIIGSHPARLSDLSYHWINPMIAADQLADIMSCVKFITIEKNYVKRKIRG